jgi:hypothetical protein
MYQNMDEIEFVVHKFERCEYTPAEFTHARHLTVAAWYLSRVPASDALKVMREKLVQFSRHHGKMGYHETITRFWLDLVANYLRDADLDKPLTFRINELVGLYADKNILFQHYTRELVMSDEARAQWVPPDLSHPANQ